ncbi:MAG: hypothetical protein BGO94_05860 [Micrococcales bacterium 72-143]|nr:MAG: hypothetical protein BGO94_05860 [Micrococcales bacterium 72-143]
MGTRDLFEGCRKLVPTIFEEDIQGEVLDALREAEQAQKHRGTVVHERWIPAKDSELTWVAGEKLYKSQTHSQWSLDQLRDISDSLARSNFRLRAAAILAYEATTPNLRERAPRAETLALLRGQFIVTSDGGARLTRPDLGGE